MTLPASGLISLRDISLETGNVANYASSLNWANSLTKPEQRVAIPNLNFYHSKAYIQRNNEGNCTQNCTVDCDCGVYDSGTNCIPIDNVNCINCDSRPWLQTNCNCQIPSYYNCTYRHTTVDCDCDCNCNCS